MADETESSENSDNQSKETANPPILTKEDKLKTSYNPKGRRQWILQAKKTIKMR